MAMRGVSVAPLHHPRSAFVHVDVARILLVGAISVLLGIVASAAFDGLEWPLFVPPATLTAAAILVRRRSLLPRLGVAAAAAVGSVAIAGVWAGADDPSDLLSGIFSGPRRLLSTEWPSPADPRVVVAVAGMLALVAAAAAELAGRRDLHALPLLPPAIGLAGAMAIAAPRRPDTWLLWAIAVLALALMLLPNGEEVRSRRTDAGR